MQILKRLGTPRHNSNIEPGCPGSLIWNPNDSNASLTQLLAYVENEADKAITWYWRSKRWKARCSRLIQISALLLTALGGLFPVAAYLLKELKWPYPSESGLWSSLFVGIAAALIGLDRTFGLSSGWARYVLTATSIRKSLEEFRMDWTLLACKTNASAAPEQIATLVERAKEFRLSVESMVLQETRDWATEFQSNIAQMEKEVKAQLETLKGQLERTEQIRASAPQPSSIELSIANAETADNGKIRVLLEDSNGGQVASEELAAGNKWVHLNVAPGHYRLA